MKPKVITKKQSWNRKDHENKKKKPEEINTMIAEAVSKALKAQKKEHEEEANNIDALLNLNIDEDASLSE